MINRETALSCLENLRELDSDFETDFAQLINYALDWAESLAADDAGEDVRLAFLAAAKMNYLLALREAGESSVSSFTAGDVSVKEESGNSVKAAESVLKSALCDAGTLIKSNGFAFMGV